MSTVMPPTRREKEEKERERDRRIHDSAPAGSQESPKKGITTYNSDFVMITGILGTNKIDDLLKGPAK